MFKVIVFLLDEKFRVHTRPNTMPMTIRPICSSVARKIKSIGMRCSDLPAYFFVSNTAQCRMRNERSLSMIKIFFALAFRQLLSAFFSFTLERHQHLCFVDDREIDMAGQRRQ
ncbi:MULTISPECIES: hypothetical protein [unclassified Undibacterium]|uniref:hypothetical protein n=1 Tax=unclassified Undibacterium TaxID=2630295 RepID=UPI002AC90552|nr:MULTISPECIES: hypothetical protein [unclassified Undibacterium]MEB0140757.1 hypothetical protein [Undibacterium sp. CCC2.1]MEB0173956.1 hypothetical protein [Undibacterium sp. CCC1.1]MEB0177744.1 hypothetical protein [Undibacterium sp. CCC3.4]MEB0217125.1 hypothetical protein [Undibacterium sp. 5I2]WPX45550.1 hypothetical protein RHM61_10195 [Undibacterium sp. CCC3.4]